MRDTRAREIRVLLISHRHSALPAAPLWVSLVLTFFLDVDDLHYRSSFSGQVLRVNKTDGTKKEAMATAYYEFYRGSSCVSFSLSGFWTRLLT